MTPASNGPALSRRSFLAVAAAVGAAAAPPAAAADGRPALPKELNYQSATRLAAMIRRKEVSSEEVVRACLKRIEQVNPKLNAVVTPAEERALREAKQADADLARGVVRGPLHGVPMTVKDSFDTAGVKSTAGTTGRKGFVPDRDATAVARLRAAGAILLGKTNTPDLTLSYETTNDVFGPTHNPYGLTRSPGGSSGGAAAIVAAGGAPFDLGSDTGGSIRLPSGLCGIAGLKPTTGRMPLTGHIIAFGLGAVDPLTQVGPLARTVEDLRLLAPILAGPDGLDPGVVPVPWPDPAQVRVEGLRVAVYTDNGIVAAEAEVANVVRTAAKALAAAGAVVRAGRPKALERAADLVHRLFAADEGEGVLQLLRRVGTGETEAFRQWKQGTKPISVRQFGDLLREWQRYRADMHAFLRDADAILCPVYPYAAMSPGDGKKLDLDKVCSHTAAYNLTGWPGAVVRGGSSKEGLPIGVQVVAGPWREDIVLAVAGHLEKSLGGWRPPPL